MTLQEELRGISGYCGEIITPREAERLMYGRWVSTLDRAARALDEAEKRSLQLEALLREACATAEREAERRAIKAELGVGEWRSFVPVWFSSARAALAEIRGGK